MKKTLIIVLAGIALILWVMIIFAALTDFPLTPPGDNSVENIPVNADLDTQQNALVDLDPADPTEEGEITPQAFKLGSEVLFDSKRHLVQGKKVGLVTNQSGVDRRGKSTLDILHEAEDIELVALYAPEHGLDGVAAAGEYVESYQHEKLGIPVYSLYGKTRMPTAEMLSDIELLIYDIQDIGARSYTYISTLNYCMIAAAENNLPVMVLDRPNPLGGLIVEGPVLEERFKSFVGVDLLPMAHGMTVGELARFFNREIGAEIIVVPMEGYNRSMLFPDLELEWVQTSPNIPDLEAVFGYLATGQGEGTGIFQADKFRWVGGRGLDEREFARLLTDSGLEGVEFIPERRGEAGGVLLSIVDPHLFNPARTGIYALVFAFALNDFHIPKSSDTRAMFDLLMGTDRMGKYLEEGLSLQEIEALLAPELDRFRQERAQYLLPQYDSGFAAVKNPALPHGINHGIILVTAQLSRLFIGTRSGAMGTVRASLSI